jgi:hypothetical protein
MKTKSLATLILTVWTIGIMAQPGNRMEERKKEFQAQKIAFLTTKLDLTPEEAQVFWPVYNELENARQAHHKKFIQAKMEMKKKIRSGEEMSDAEIEAFLLERFEEDREKADIEEKYFKKLKAVLPMKKLAILYGAEEEFRMKMLRQYKNSKDAPSPPRPPKP